MAIHENLIDKITALSDSWEGKTGEQVEDFICRRLDQPLGSTITYENETLTLYNPEGKEVASGKVTVVKPNYNTVISFPQLVVSGNVNEGNVELNYTSTSTFEAGINVKTYYESSGQIYNLSNKVSVTFYIEGTTDQLIVNDIIPNKDSDNTLQFVDITPLFQKNLQGATIKATVTANGKTDTQAYPGKVTIHKIELSTASTYVDNKTVVFNINGLKSTSGMFLEYFDVLLGTDPTSVSKQQVALTGTSSTELVLETTGAHQIVARISNGDASFYSNWVQANVISYDSTSPESMMVVIGGIPTDIINCENANLYNIICVPGLGGEAEISSYLTDEAGNFDNNTNWDEYLFNQTSINTTSNDSPKTSAYYSYVELTSVGSSQKALAFKLRIKEGNQYKEYPIYQLSVSKTGRLTSAKYFTINIQENPYNVNNAFNYTEGPKEDFSQITGQATTLFNDVNPDIDSSDGWTVDENLIAYKISGQNKNLYNQPKDFSTLLSSGQGFTIEVMLKNYNINGEDPVMNIGNLLFGPGFTRIDSDDKSDEGIFVNSRADFEKDVITHLTFVFDPNYKPNTYSNIYNQIFDEGGINYASIAHNYPILKVFVNGCINREIQVTADELKNAEGFKLQICPKSSDLNLYIFRTYTRALNYAEIQKNFISSRTTSIEKKNIYDRNNILAEDGRISFYKAMLNNNVIVFVLPVGEKPLFFGNKDTAGDGQSNATILVRYKDPAYKSACGRLTGGKYKAQGSSAKKYMFHNTQYSKGTFLSEEQIAAGVTEGASAYVIPTDPEKIAAKKLVGKVNYASSMQSHKQGATKLYDRAYKEIFPEGTLYNGGKKACLEEAFMYFYYNVDDNSKLNTITIEDLYTTENINGITVAHDSDVKFFGFQTWGSAKADDPTYGYGDDTTEYVLFEGADNASPGANFHQPWAAFQTWTSTKTKKENQNTAGLMVQQPKEVTATDFTTGLLIEGETIQFENDTDPLDVDYGVELIVLDGQSKDDAEDRDLWKFTDAVKENSLPYFVQFYNNCYQYDFTNLILNPNSETNKFDIRNSYNLTNKRIYMNVKTTLYDNGVALSTQANAGDVYRWDGIKSMWVPAGLHYVNNNWEPFNLKEVYTNLVDTDLYNKYKNNKEIISADFEASLTISENSVNDIVIPAFRDMFKATVEEYCDKDDIAYHQAFIKLVSGTDNRAKNTYFQIIGKKYTKNESGEFVKDENAVGDYKIRLMQDDLDTIFATDNNGQQVKPYYLLEPPFNKDTEEMWGDDHSSFFYPFDICYEDLVNEYVGKIINHLFGASTSIKSEDAGCNLYNYFFSIQKQFPEIAYNHHAEIYYEMPQVLFHNNELLKINGMNVFPNTLSGFANNSVKNPLSLSHGRCLESEYQFMKDRLLLLGTATLSASGLYASDRINISTVSTGGDADRTTLKGSATYTDYFYPIRSTNSFEYHKIGNITSLSNTLMKPDDVFMYVLDYPHIPSSIRQLVTPTLKYNVACDVITTMGSFLNLGSKYKTLEITQGLDYTHSLLNLPNAQSLVIDGLTSNYSVTDSNIIVRNYLPIVETLTITNTSFTNTVLDLRGCNRLEELNLSGCTGIVDIIFPETNRLRSVYLPSGLKKLTLSRNPNLSNLVFADGTYLTDISIDCSDFNSNLDYLDILLNRIDYSNLNQFIVKNTPEGGLLITEELATRLASVKNDKDVVSLITGTFNITNRDTQYDSYNNVTYVWGEPTDISYNTKKYLVGAFGNIDSTSNAVVFKYQSSTLMRNTYKLPAQIAIDAPNGGKFKPFDSLYFATGNNVGITDEGLLNIYYKVSGLPTGCSINSATGELSVSGNTNTTYEYSITVTLTTGQSLQAITGSIYLGYLEPEIGNYAYADGTFSSMYDDEKTLVGLVFQKEVVTPGQKWKLGILSKEAITDYSGAAYYLWDNSTNDFPANSEQGNIHMFMTHANGLNISMPTGPVALAYTGLSEGSLDVVPTTVVDYNYMTTLPTTLVESGLEDTVNLATVGYNRIRTIAKSTSSGFYKYLQNNEYLDSQGEFTGNWNYASFDTIFNEFNSQVKRDGFNTTADYYKVLNPLAIKANTFEPEDLSKEGVTYYSKGNWYIPSDKEIELLVWYRIRSTTTSTTTNSNSYWDSTAYNGGDSIFSDKSIHFDGFLTSTLVSSKIGTSNQNIVYGEKEYYNYSTNGYSYRYGWFGDYRKNDYTYEDETLESCRRDFKYSITPCCTITVTKPS